MLNNTNFSNRLKKVMEFYQISASAFAETIEVPRSSISHILSGRNKPSLDFVLKTIETYQEVDLYWLLKGIGSFPKSTLPPLDNDLNSIKKTREQSQKTQTEHKEVQNQQAPNESTQEQEAKQIALTHTHDYNQPEGDIDKVLVFYTDGTFKAYRNRDKQ